jgi:hypothetical protein
MFAAVSVGPKLVGSAADFGMDLGIANRMVLV